MSAVIKWNSKLEIFTKIVVWININGAFVSNLPPPWWISPGPMVRALDAWERGHRFDSENLRIPYLNQLHNYPLPPNHWPHPILANIMGLLFVERGGGAQFVQWTVANKGLRTYAHMHACTNACTHGRMRAHIHTPMRAHTVAASGFGLSLQSLGGPKV